MERWEELQKAGKQAVRLGDHAKARELFVESMREAEPFGDTDERWKSAFTVAVAFFHFVIREYATAEALYRRRIQYLERLGPSKELANEMQSLALVLCQQKRIAEARAVDKAIRAMWPPEEPPN